MLGATPKMPQKSRPITPSDQLHFATTDDGWQIALHHYRPKNGCKRAHPVLLCHGLASSHIAFDVDPEVSLARHLAARGYDVFAIDLRGHGASDRPSRRGPKRFGWAFDDYLLRDLPAAFAFATRHFGLAGAHYVGHSMGGLLLYAHLAVGGSSDIRSAVTVGSSLDYSASPSGFHSLLPFQALLRRLPAIPVDVVARVSGALTGRVRTPFERFNVWPTNVDLALWKRQCESGFHRVSTPVMAQLASAMEPGGLRSRDGSRRYFDGLAAASAPVLALAGDRDAQCPPEAANVTLSALGSARKELRVLGRDHGEDDHYGHFDLLIGRRAKREVFPRIDAWLDEHDEPSDSPA